MSSKPVTEAVINRMRQLATREISSKNPSVGTFKCNGERCSLHELMVLYDIMGHDVYEHVVVNDIHRV